MRLFLIMAVLVALAACSNSTPPVPTVATTPAADLTAIKAAEDAAMRANLSCIDQAAKRLDDQKSDPATIAQGALSACGKEFDATVEVFSRNYDNYLAVKEKVTTQLRQSSMDYAIKQILINRKTAHGR